MANLGGLIITTHRDFIHIQILKIDYPNMRAYRRKSTNPLKRHIAVYIVVYIWNFWAPAADPCSILTGKKFRENYDSTLNQHGGVPFHRVAVLK